MTVYQPVKVEDGSLLINGEWIETSARFETINPATEETLANVSEGSAEHIDVAVNSARRALEEGPWSTMAPRQRGELMLKLADLIEENKERLAILESMDNGKPIRETMAFDIPQVIETFRYYAGWTDKILGDVNAVNQNFFSCIISEPVIIIYADIIMSRIGNRNFFSNRSFHYFLVLI